MHTVALGLGENLVNIVNTGMVKQIHFGSQNQ